MAYRYLGNKSKIADWISAEIRNYLPAPALIADPMCGTASVSEALAQKGYSMISSDALRFPTLHAKARLLHRKAPNFENFGGYENILRSLNDLRPFKGYFYQEFGEHGRPTMRDRSRLYFSAANAAKIDAIRGFIKTHFENKSLTELERDLLLHDLILAVNSVANIAGTYGYFRSRVTESAKKPLKITPSRFSELPGDHSVVNGDAKEVLSDYTVDAVYLDPPYTKRQYAGNYHILETIAREDEPLALGEGGLRPWTKDASDFCYKRKVARAFREVIEASNTRYFFISYSEDGHLSPNMLFELLNDYGPLTVRTQDYSRYRSNRNAKRGPILEYLYCLEVR